MKKKPNSPYYTYMAPYFETGDDLLIKQAKERYRMIYKANWRKTNRSQTKTVALSFTKGAYKELVSVAKRHQSSVAKFVRDATAGYINNRYVPLHKEEITKLLQVMALFQNRIEEIAEDRGIAIVPERELKTTLSELEHQVRVLIYSPKTIWQILDRVLTDTPGIRDEILLYIQNRSP